MLTSKKRLEVALLNYQHMMKVSCVAKRFCAPFHIECYFMACLVSLPVATLPYSGVYDCMGQLWEASVLSFLSFGLPLIFLASQPPLAETLLYIGRPPAF